MRDEDYPYVEDSCPCRYDPSGVAVRIGNVVFPTNCSASDIMAYVARAPVAAEIEAD